MIFEMRWIDVTWAVGLSVAVSAGCNKGPFVNAQAGSPWQSTAPQQQAVLSQMNDLNRRASSLDADNNNLHAELAKSQQQVQFLYEKIDKLSRQLTDTANQLKEVQLARQDAEQRVAAIQASTRHRGGATITANDSLSQSLQLISIPGVEVNRDNDVIRIVLPTDRLFVADTAQPQPSAQYLLDQVADAISRNYPRQMIGIEAHTDSGPAPASTAHQLAALQSVAVYSTLTGRNRLPSRQLFTVAHGANHPLASNGTAAGRSKNRRVEIVVYPDTVQ
jgi:chemotaxis protein MotB